MLHAGREPARPPPTAARRGRSRPPTRRAGSASRVTATELPGQQPLRLGPLRRVLQADTQRAGADRRLELSGVPSAMTLPWSMTAMRVGQLVGLLEVLRGQQDGRSLGDEAPGRCPIPGCGCGGRARSSARRGTCSSGRHHDAGGDVEPAAHASREVLDQLGRRVAEAERLEQLGGAVVRGPTAQAQQPAEQHEVLPAGEVLVHRRQLAGEADDGPDRIGLLDHVVAQHPCTAGVGADEGGQDADGGGLAGAVGAEDAVHRCRGGTARSTPSTANVSPNALTRPSASMARELTSTSSSSSLSYRYRRDQRRRLIGCIALIFRRPRRLIGRERRGGRLVNAGVGAMVVLVDDDDEVVIGRCGGRARRPVARRRPWPGWPSRRGGMGCSIRSREACPDLRRLLAFLGLDEAAGAYSSRRGGRPKAANSSG